MLRELAASAGADLPCEAYIDASRGRKERQVRRDLRTTGTVGDGTNFVPAEAGIQKERAGCQIAFYCSRYRRMPVSRR